MLPRDSNWPPYRTGDETLTGLVSYVVTIPATMWYQAAWMDSQLSMTSESMWQQSGSVTIEDATQAASVSYGALTTMVGMIFLWAGVTDPPFAALACDGEEYERSAYPSLYAMLTAFQTGPDTFTTPDLRGRVPLGTGSGYGIGDTGGATEVVLTGGQLAIHEHIIPSLTVGLAVAPGELLVEIPNLLEPIGTTEPAGNDEPHTNMQPYIALEYWIMAQ